MGECHTGTVTSATTTTLVDSSQVDTARDSAYFGTPYLYIVSGTQAGTLRRVSEYAPSTGTFTLSRSWTGPAAGSEYELHTRISPIELNKCIDRGLKGCDYLDEQEIAVVAEQRQYSLATYTWLTRRQQVLDVFWKYGTESLQYRYLPVEWYEIRDDSGALTLDIRPVAYRSGDTLVLRAVRPYAALATDADTTECPEDWAVAAGLYQAYKLLCTEGPAADVQMYQQRKAEAAAELAMKNRYYQPRTTRRILGRDGLRRGIDSSIVSPLP